MTLRRPPLARRLLAPALRAIAALALAALGLGAYLWLSTPLPAPERLRAGAALGSTRILDRQGRLLYALPDPFTGWQRPVPLASIAPALRDATIAVEDAGFYANPGVDLRGILRAAWSNLRSGRIVAGGSTITQQLARGFLLDPDLARQQSLERKLREAVLALKLTARLPKDEILALYLNQIYYGGMSYGVEAAARYYFGKPAADLDLAEAALLAGLPQAPAAYDPFAHPEAARARQAQVLAAMVRAGMISPEAAARAAAEPLALVGRPPAMAAPHFVTMVLDELAAHLGPDPVLRGGLTVTTTLDLGLQEVAQAALRRRLAELAAPRDGGPARAISGGAVVVLDPADGAILTLVGSPDFADSAAQGQVNGALALRQPGSAIKPLTYALALGRGWTPATVILDVPSTFPGPAGPPYAPENYDRAFHGPLSLREALATSSNVAAVRALDFVGGPALLELAARLGVTSLGRDAARHGLALTLGSGEVRPLELTAAYAAFAAGGERVTPYAVSAVAGPDGRALPLGALGPRPRERAVSPEVAYLISDILSDPYARMRAFGADSPLDVGRPAAAKTGTTSDWRDNWALGYTPDRAVGVWVGNPDGRPMQGVSGISGAGPVWNDVMRAAHRGLPPRPFARPPGVVELAVCADSGLLPGPACPATRSERFIAGTAPTRADDAHLAVRLDPRLGCRAPAGYPAERTVTRIFYLPPPGAEAWAAEVGLPRPPASVCPSPSAAGGAAPAEPAPVPYAPPGEPAILSPGDGAVFRMSPGVPPERQRLAIEAQAGGPVARLTIVVDGAPVASFGGPPYRALWQLLPGEHTAWVEVHDGAGNVSRSTPVIFTVTE